MIPKKMNMAELILVSMKFIRWSCVSLGTSVSQVQYYEGVLLRQDQVFEKKNHAAPSSQLHSKDIRAPLNYPEENEHG